MPRLLLVEDNEHIARIYSEKFGREGFTVTVAHDGEQGLAVAQSQPPDIMLLDLMLPKMSGFDVLKHLRENPKTSAIPVFVLSNRSWPDDVQKALGLGARQFYSKGSTSMQEIVMTIRTECHLKKVMILTRNVTSATPILLALQHPRLLCSVVMVLAEVGNASERGLPDAVVLDGRPPVTNATVLLQQIKSSHTAAAVPVIAITDQPQTMFRAEACVASGKIDSELRSLVFQKIGLTEDSPALTVVGG